jgi:outer membrane protein assembly factor BamB
MSELRDLLDREASRVAAPPDALDVVVRRVERRHRRQRLGTALVALAIAAAAIGYAVRMFNLVPQATSITPDNVKDLKVAWKAQLDGSASGSALNRIANPRAPGMWPNPILWAPAADANTVYVASASGTLFAYPTSCGSSGATCEPDWVASTGGGVRWAPTVSDGEVFVATTDGKVLAYPAGCGTGGGSCPPDWIGTVTNWASSSPVVSGGIVYVGDHLSAQLFAFPVDCATGGGSCSPLWVAQAGPPWSSTGLGPIPLVNENSEYAPVVAGGVVYALSITHDVYAFDAATGAPLWIGPTDPADAGLEGRFNSVAVSDGFVFVGATGGPFHEQQLPKLYAFRIGCATGGAVCQPVWTAQSFEGGFAQPVAADGVVYVGSFRNAGHGHVSAFPADCPARRGTCDPLWVGRAEDEANTYYPIVAGDHVFTTSGILGSTDAFSVSCRGTCTPEWRTTQVPGQRLVTQMPLVSGELLFTANGSTIRAFDQNCGTGGVACQPLWTWRVPSGIASTPTVIGGELVVVTSTGGVYALTPGGVS